MAKWTIEEAPDLTGKLAIVTGANSGLGYASSLALASKGASVVLAVRTANKGDAARKKILKTLPNCSLRVMPLDLADLSSIESFAGKFKDLYDRLDILINNAGVMALPKRLTQDGFEMQFGTNHLGHFALTGRLIDRLMATGASRVVNVSSGLHRNGTMNFADLMGDIEYDKWSAYAQSKLANLLFSNELQRKLAAAGSSSISVGAHPGFVDTNLARRGPEMEKGVLIGWFVRVYIKLKAGNASDGVLPQLYAAVMPDVTGGNYIGPKPDSPDKATPQLQEPIGAAHDEKDALRLWQMSEALTGVEYSI